MNATVRSSSSTISAGPSPAAIWQKMQSGSPIARGAYSPPVPDERARLETEIRHLASIDRPSASPGEREAAEWIAARLEEAGCRGVRVEEERAHGGYWWPLGLLCAAGGLAGLGVAAGRRRAGALAGLAAAALWDDLDHRTRVFRRAALPKRATWNVTAELGDPATPAHPAPRGPSRRGALGCRL